MSPKKYGGRLFVIVLISLMCFLGYIMQLMSMQIVRGEEYQGLVEQGYSTRQTISAARGEIVDCYGRALATNRISLDVIFDRSSLPFGRENGIILALFDVLDEAEEDWNDNLPLSKTAPFVFDEERPAAVSALKKHLLLEEFATADDVVYWLKESYGLFQLPDNTFRRLAGVRYEMERTGFNVSTPYTFASDVSTRTMTIINERNYEFPGVDVIETSDREYVSGDIAPHIIGMIGPIYEEEYAKLDHNIYGMNDMIGKSGIEQTFEEQLRGTDGVREITFNSKGEMLSSTVIQEPVPGNTIVLTIESRLQATAQAALEKQILNLRATAPEHKGKESEGGACVVIKVGTGEVLAAAVYPSYNLETFKQDYNELLATDFNPLFNRALAGTYAAGSTFKPLVATAGLMEGVINANTTVLCEGVYTFYKDYQPTCLQVHGRMDLRHALGYSCNVFFYETGRLLGIEMIQKYASYYGLGQVTGIEIPENIGHVSSPDQAEKYGQRWENGDVLQSAIGQSFNLFSPLQFANYAATIANKGIRLNAHLVKSVNSYNFDSLVYETPTEVVSDMEMPDWVYEAVKGGMLQSSQDSSGEYWTGFPLSVASKTGTPETTSGYPNSTFICFAPAENPEIAIAVIIEKGWHGYTGAPVAREVMEEYFFGGTGEGFSPPENALLP